MKLWPLLDRVYAVLAVAAVLMTYFFRHCGTDRGVRADPIAGRAGRMAQLKGQA